MSSNPGKPLDDTIPARGSGSQPPDRPSRQSSPTTPPPPGQERYQIDADAKELGRGGMGRVVEAYDVQLGRTVALKEVLPKAGNASARRFEREVELTAKLEHPSIVPLYDSGRTPDGRPYYVMRRVTGHPLDELIMRRRRLDDRLALLPALQSAIDAVAHAHSRGVIHRDLKPANILVGELGETVVIDWGLAKVIGEDDEPATRDSLASDSLQTQMGSVFGTPGFMAPEQARGEELGTHGDVYALGATLYQLLAGTPPHAGNSATEVIDKTLRHAMIPLREIAPGAPIELVTIVNKALAPEPEQRYPNAGALGEDLRRFTAGQLVAAHSYTPWQRILRFTRKHRGAVLVAAFALSALAVLSWIGVRRIIHERDEANIARAAALADKRAVEKANKELADRHDALLVSKARARLDINPTEALATLKSLPASSTQLEEARAVAQAALMRGVTWAIQSTLSFTFIAEISPDGHQLLQVSRDGMIRVWDIDNRKLSLARPFPQLTRAVWLTEGKLLVTQHKSAPAILDPKTNTLDNLSGDPITFALSDATGAHVVFESPVGVGVFDAATRTTRILAPGVKASDVAISPDGKNVMWTDPKTATLTDFDGKVIASIPGVATLEFSPAHKVAVLTATEIKELDLDAPKPEFKVIAAPDARSNDLLISMIYRQRELVVLNGRGTFWGWDGKNSYVRTQLNDITAGMRPADKDYVLMMTTDNKVHYMQRGTHGMVQMPANLEHARLVARAESSQVLVVADGIILGFDLAAVRPKLMPVDRDTFVQFVDDNTLLATHSASRGWDWIDIETEKRTPVDFASFGPHLISDIDGDRVLVKQSMGPMSAIYLLTKNSSKTKKIVDGENSWARLVPGNAIIFGTGADARAMAIIGDGAPQEIAKLDGVVDGGASLGHLRAAFHSTGGELIRADLTTGKIDRTNVPVGVNFFIQADPSGRVVLAEDKRVMLWDGTITELGTFDKPIEAVLDLQGAVAVSLQNHETFLLDLKGGQPLRVFPPGRYIPEASLDARVMITTGNTEQITVLELPSRVRWSVPPFYKNMYFHGPIISPHTRRVIEQIPDYIVMYQLPLAPSQDFAQWLDEQTNATVDIDGELIWPWQQPNPKL